MTQEPGRARERREGGETDRQADRQTDRQTDRGDDGDDGDDEMILYYTGIKIQA